MESDIVDVEKLVEQSKSILKGETIPKSSEDIQKTFETIGSEVEQVRYAEGEKLSETGQAILKDLEEILVGGAEVTAAIPPETFLHAARAQQKVSEAAKLDEASEKVAEGEDVVMNFGSLLRMLFGSNEFRDVLADWSKWLKDVLIVQYEQVQKAIEPTTTETAIGQVPVEDEPKGKIPEINDEQLDKLIGMLEWMQERQEYQQAIGYIFNQFSNLPSILGIEIHQEEPQDQKEKTILDRDKLMAAIEEAKIVALDTLKALENWTNRSTLKFKTHLKSFSDHLKSDQDLNYSIQALSHFLANCINEPGFLNDRQWIRDEARDRLEQVRIVIEKEGYKEDFECLVDETGEVIKSINREPRTAHLKESFRKLLEDLFISEGGKPGISAFRLKTELIDDMGIIVGSLLQRAKYLRVPDVEIHDEDLDFVAKNIILDAAELIPQQFKMTFVTENMVEKAKQKEMMETELTEEDKQRIFVEREVPTHPTHPDPTSSFTSVSSVDWQSHLKFEVKGIHGHCRNVHFNVRKRSGFPQLTDEGLADLRVWGPKGMIIKVILRPEWIKLETIERESHTKETIQTNPSSTHPSITPQESTSKISSSETSRKFKLSIVKAHCEIDELDLDLHGTRRDWFYTVLGPLVRKRVKDALERAVEENLSTLMD